MGPDEQGLVQENNHGESTMNLLYVTIAYILSAIFYRAGGMGKEVTAKPSWIPKWMRFSLMRDVPCSALLITLAMVWFGVSDNWLGYVVSFGLSWAALSTYYDSIFGHDNYFAHGLGCGLAGLPLLMCGVPLWILLIRLIICTLGMGIWSKKVTVDYQAEFGRGVFFIL